MVAALRDFGRDLLIEQRRDGDMAGKEGREGWLRMTGGVVKNDGRGG